ncbi:hypothetical protein BJX61DRAFT_545488 [Aspergillus egyptiacus]|nr:hypothetical protein BJX61DRAFT_545488 [Aspergillus egyptiacus]
MDNPNIPILQTDCLKHISHRRLLFRGGVDPWPGMWETTTSSPGGMAYSKLSHMSHSQQSDYYGWVDRRIIKPSNFTAVRTIGIENHWDLSEYNAIEIQLGGTDEKVYNLWIEDQHSRTFEASFRGLKIDCTRVIRFSRFGLLGHNVVNPAGPAQIDLANIKGFGICIRNTSEAQEGPFWMSIVSISAVKLDCNCRAVLDELSEEYMMSRSKRLRMKSAFRRLKDRMVLALQRLTPRRLKNRGSQ